MKKYYIEKGLTTRVAVALNNLVSILAFFTNSDIVGQISAIDFETMSRFELTSSI